MSWTIFPFLSRSSLLIVVVALLWVLLFGLKDRLDVVDPGLDNATGSTNRRGLVVSVGGVVSVSTPYRECFTRKGTQFSVDGPKRIAVTLTSELYSVVVFVEENI